MMVRRRGRRLGGRLGGRLGCRLASGLAALALVAGCGGVTETGGARGSGSSPGSHRSASPPASPRATESPRATQTAPETETAPETGTETGSAPETGTETGSAPETGTETGSASPDARQPLATTARGIRGRLLSAGEMPGFNVDFSWRTKHTSMREGREPFGTCHRFAMTSIGATRVAVRRYSPAVTSPGATASNLVARFADARTAKRAYAVLEAWHDQCADRLRKHDTADVGRIRQVGFRDAPVGDWYLLVYGPAGDAGSSYFDAQGLVRVGSTVSVLEMRLVGQDYDYPRGKAPMVAAVRHAATRIG